MSVYCISNIHGDYESYREMLRKIKFCDRDTLYVIGNVVDIGSGSLKILRDMMMRINVIPIIGDHEYMATRCLKYIMECKTHKRVAPDNDMAREIVDWHAAGGQSTIDEFHKLSEEEQEDIIDYLEEFSLYEEIEVKGKDYVLVHGGFADFDPDRDLDDYHIDDVLFTVPDYSKVYFEDKILVTARELTSSIKDNPVPDRIYKGNNHIAINCGTWKNLAAVCLDNGEEFYLN